MRLRELEMVEEEVSVFVPWRLILRCTADGCGTGYEARACSYTGEGFDRHCIQRVTIEILSLTKISRISCPFCRWSVRETTINSGLENEA